MAAVKSTLELCCNGARQPEWVRSLDRQDLKEVVALARQGKIKPTPTKAVPVAEINQSMDLLRAGKVSGRIVLTHSPN